MNEPSGILSSSIVSVAIVGRQESRHVEERAKREVAEVGGRGVVADHSVRQQGERIGFGATKDARPLDA